MIGQGTNALASSIVLVCRQRPVDVSTITRRDFVAALKSELPPALAQSAIGPGMAVYSRYAKVLDASGKVRLLKPDEMTADWHPATDRRLTNWETVHQLIRVLESGGETAAAQLVKALGEKAETARELCYRLYTICERKKRAKEALSYNGLVQSFPELVSLAREGGSVRKSADRDLLDDGES